MWVRVVALLPQRLKTFSEFFFYSLRTGPFGATLRSKILKTFISALEANSVAISFLIALFWILAHLCRTYFYKIMNKSSWNSSSVYFGDFLNNYFSFLYTIVTKKPPGTLWYKPPIAEKYKFDESTYYVCKL